MDRSLFFLAVGTAAGLAALAADAAPLQASFEPRRPLALISECAAPAPAVGQAFKGPVLQVIDGQTLCVALGPTPKDWIRVRVAGVPTSSSREALMAASFGQDLSCMAVKSARPGAEARCSLNGAPLGR